MRTLRMILGIALAVLAVAADWPNLLGPTRNGVSAEKLTIEAWTKKGPMVAWQRSIGASYSSPVVAGGTLYFFHRVDDQEVLEALDAKTGKGRWKFAYKSSYSDDYGKGDGPRSTPTVAGGKVFTLGADGVLSCVDVKDGKQVWQKALHSDYEVKKNFFGVGTSPLVEGDRVLVNVGGSEAGIVCFAADTGKELWKATEEGASYSSPTAATIDGVRHVFFLAREGLVSIDPATGKVRFTRKFRARINASVNAATPLVLGEKYLFLSASYQTGAVLLEVKKDSVAEVWKSNEVLSAHFNTPVPVGAYLYGADGRQEEGARLRCIDWKAGKVKWTENGFGCGSVIAVGEQLVLMSEDGELILAAANGEKFEEKARAKVLDKPVRAHLALADGLLYSHDGKKLVCWKMEK